jgi:hypothetical protein
LAGRGGAGSARRLNALGPSSDDLGSSSLTEVTGVPGIPDYLFWTRRFRTI